MPMVMIYIELYNSDQTDAKNDASTPNQLSTLEALLQKVAQETGLLLHSVNGISWCLKGQGRREKTHILITRKMHYLMALYQ